MKPLSLKWLPRAGTVAVLVALPGLHGVQPAGAAQTNTTARTVARAVDYSDFKVVSERNIFNPKRTPGRSATSERPVQTTRRTSYSRSETIALVGTMSYAKGPYAFFDSSSYQYKKVASAGETIADCKVLRVEPALVELEWGTNSIELPVGMQLQRQENGGWKVTERSFSYDSSYSRGAYASRDRRDSRDRGEDRGPGTGEPPAGMPGEDSPPIIVINTGEAMDEPAPPPEPEPAAAAPSAGSGANDSVLEALRARAARERGE